MMLTADADLEGRGRRFAGASLVVLSATCASIGLPVEWIATILGVDEIMDMAERRSTVSQRVACAVRREMEGSCRRRAALSGRAPKERV